MNGFKIIGISVRTTNAENKSQKDLQQLWSTFFSESILDKIPNKLNSEVLAIYTDYTSDFTEDYTTIIGVKVSNIDTVPNGLIGREFKSENFEVFTAKGNMPEAVVNTWVDIWSKDKELNRKYTYDFEVYGEKSQNGDKSEVDIYIAK